MTVQNLNLKLKASSTLPKGPYVIYGAGNSGKDVAKILLEKDQKITAFIDKDADSIVSVGGIPCVKPVKTHVHKLKKLCVIIAVFNSQVNPNNIKSKLEELGFNSIISYYSFYGCYPELVISKYWLASKELYTRKTADIGFVEKILSDKKSRQIFLEIIGLRTNLDINMLCDPDLLNQYFPSDIPRLKDPVRFVDGGSYNGDSIKEIRQRGYCIEALACFEPDPINFSYLSKYIMKNLFETREASLYPCGLGSVLQIQRFKSGNNAASTFCDDGESLIQTAPLDELIPNFHPTFIKLDVEGFESASLKGAEKTIRRYRPTLAVCLYHKPLDIFELPKLIYSMTPNYNYYLRYHGFNGLEIVFYAIPRDPKLA
jgi:FkbM family methyltransferase